MERTGEDVQSNGSGGLTASTLYDAANPPFDERPQQSAADRPRPAEPAAAPTRSLPPALLAGAAAAVLALVVLLLLRARRAGAR